MEKLQQLFVNEESMRSFQESYLNAYRGNHEIDYFGWDSVVDDIYETAGQSILDVGDFVTIEISSTFTKSKNPELIEVGQLVEIPVPDPDQANDPDFNDETGFIGDYVGDYKFS